MADWRRAIERQWPAMRFGEMKVGTDGGEHVFEVQFYFNGARPERGAGGALCRRRRRRGPLRQEMQRVRQLAGEAGGYAYGGRAPATRPATDYTARAMPNHTGAAVPLETARILWQR